ncbi:hypothetical protein JB92DRAFT_3032426 [Gautieria morchelliformis]|nr:hypothetical protein JB92DRAFT_3032426 [Gautieria morchelliformis]
MTCPLPDSHVIPLLRGAAVTTNRTLSKAARGGLHRYYNSQAGLPQIVFPFDIGVTRQSNILNSVATFYKYLIKDGQRIIPVSEAIRHSAHMALVRVQINGQAHYGEVQTAFEHYQTGCGQQLFLEIRWMIPAPMPPQYRPTWQHR